LTVEAGPWLETERLILRQWRDDDREPYADFLTDHEVGKWLGGPFNRQQAFERVTANAASLAETGLGRLAIERRADAQLIGYCGLVNVVGRPPIPDGLEIGWTIAPHAWGSGYAVEAARAVIADGFDRHGAMEILAFTGVANERSQAVAHRLGMTRRPEQDFDHPGLADDHPLKRHVVFALQRA
jgi:RimJ/RimL family protein N-acetyltransferase